jgi:hypothetical protein
MIANDARIRSPRRPSAKAKSPKDSARCEERVVAPQTYREEHPRESDALYLDLSASLYNGFRWWDQQLVLAKRTRSVRLEAAAARVLKALAIAYRNGDEQELFRLEEIARAYIRRVSCDVFVPRPKAVANIVEHLRTWLRWPVERDANLRFERCHKGAMLILCVLGNPALVGELILELPPGKPQTPRNVAAIASLLDETLCGLPGGQQKYEEEVERALPKLVRDLLIKIGYPESRADSLLDAQRKAKRRRHTATSNVPAGNSADDSDPSPESQPTIP